MGLLQTSDGDRSGAARLCTPRGGQAAATGSSAPACLTGRARCRLAAVAAAAGLAGPVTPAHAQRAEANAITAAEDAFGTWNSLGNVGLYSLADARGFSPQQAGNLRIDGLYFDYVMTDPNLDPCFVKQSTMRIGIAAQSFSFPSPTGIVDLSINTPDGSRALSAQFSRGPYETGTALIEGQTPITDSVSVSACAGAFADFLSDTWRRSETQVFLAAAAWHPTPQTSLTAFWNYDPGGSHNAFPAVYIDGTNPPPLIDLRHLPSVAGMSSGWRQKNMGLLFSQAFDRGWQVKVGLFQSEERDAEYDQEEFLNVTPSRMADHVVDIAPPVAIRSVSGEFRLVDLFGSETDRRELQATVRGRRVHREFGGDAIVDNGIMSIDAPLAQALPAVATGPTSLDSVRQLDAGFVYSERWAGVGTLGLGALKSRYVRDITIPGSPTEEDRVEPWLLNFRFTYSPATDLKLYGSYVQGLEDSTLAPVTAVNRREAPPATRTYQADGGIRLVPSEHASTLLGVFAIHKAYFNLDASSVYRELGTIRNRGIEGSFNYGADGFTLVAGAVWLQPRVAYESQEPVLSGSVPVGPVPLTAMLSIDYAPAAWGPWAASAQGAYYSRRVVTIDDASELPGFGTFAAGIRYMRKLDGHTLTVRVDGSNLLNEHGLHVSTLGLVTPELGRRVGVTVSFDY